MTYRIPSMNKGRFLNAKQEGLRVVWRQADSCGRKRSYHLPHGSEVESWPFRRFSETCQAKRPESFGPRRREVIHGWGYAHAPVGCMTGTRAKFGARGH